MADLSKRASIGLSLDIDLENSKEFVRAGCHKEPQLIDNAKVVHFGHELLSKCPNACLALQVPHLQQAILGARYERLLCCASGWVLCDEWLQLSDRFSVTHQLEFGRGRDQIVYNYVGISTTTYELSGTLAAKHHTRDGAFVERELVS